MRRQKVKNETRNERKERLRACAWAHAIDFGTFLQGKFFLLFEDGKCSEPLNSANIPNEGWTGAVARVNFENPYDWEDNDYDNESEFIQALKSNVPDRWDIELEDEYEINLGSSALNGETGTLEELGNIIRDNYATYENEDENAPILIYYNDEEMEQDKDGSKAIGAIRKIRED
jgi:hypothetical protein